VIHQDKLLKTAKATNAKQQEATSVKEERLKKEILSKHSSALRE